MREIFIVIPANGRHQMITDLLVALEQPADHVIILDNGAEPPLVETHSHLATVIDNCGEPMNFQRWINTGWNIVSQRATGPYAIAFFNSDALTTRAVLENMVAALDEHNAAIVGADHCGILNSGEVYRKTVPGPGTWEHRMTGWGFVVRGELVARFDERFVWWYGDDDFDWTAMQEFGGSIVLGGTRISNRDQDGAQRQYPELYEQTNRDRITFINKWGTDTHV